MSDSRGFDIMRHRFHQRSDRDLKEATFKTHNSQRNRN